MDPTPLFESLIHLTVIVLLGMVFGSFVTLASYRLPRDQPIGMTRSQCPHCHTPLGFWDLLPILSWCFQRARCRYCRALLSWRYPLIELANVVLFLEVYRVHGWSVETFLFCALAVALLLMIVTDFEFQIIPDTVQIALFLLACAYRFLFHLSFLEGLLTGLALCVFSLVLRAAFSFWKKREALGLGDVKFFISAGMFLGMMPVAPFLFMAGMLGVFCSLVWKKLGRGDEFPFGPALAVALWISLLYPLPLP